MRANRDSVNIGWARARRFRRCWAVGAFLLIVSLLAPVPAGASGGAPGTPSSVSVERADGTLTASWPAVSGATGYHITYSSDGKQSWSLAGYDHAETSITIDGVSNSATYIVGVRALNSSGGSGWRNSPAAGPWTPPPPPPPPATPESVSVERADGTLTASWPAASGATGYHITYSSDGKQSWSLAAYDHAGTSITIGGVSNSAIYVVGVRALNASGGSGWRNSPAAGPWATPPATPLSVSVWRTDGALTASWPASEGATGYHVTYSSDGKQSWSLAAYDHAGTSITIGGVSNTATYFVAVRARNVGGGSGWRDSSASGPWMSPGTVEGLEIESGDGYLDISWDALTGATGYDVRAKAENSSTWHDVAADVSGTSHRYTTTLTLDFIAVRARGNGNAGPWTEISRMPSDDFWTGYDAQTVGASSLGGGAGLVAAEAQALAASTKLGEVTWGKIERTSRGWDAIFNVRWTAVTGADGYNFVCSESGGWHWDICGWRVSSNNTTVSYATVPTGQSQPLSITHKWRKDGPYTPGKYALSRHRHVMLAVRAVKSNDPSAAGPWAQTADIPTFSAYLWGLSHTRGDGQISMSWNATPHVTGYDVYCAVAVPGTSGDYTLCATLTNPVYTPGEQISATISTWTADGNSYSIDNTKKYDFAITSKNTWSEGRWLPPLMDPITLTASSITQTSATLTLAEYTGTWWLKRTTPADTNCKSMGTAAATGATEDLTSLTPSTPHTYKAYSNSSCTNEIVSGSFTTNSLTAPAAPTGVTASASKGGVSVAWTAPADNGGSAVTAAQVRTRVKNPQGDWTAAVDSVDDPATSPARIIGLTVGTEVDVQLRVVNAIGHSSWVDAGSATPLATTAPTGKAQNVIVTYADSKFWVRFNHTGDDGGLPLQFQFSGSIHTWNTNQHSSGLDMKAGTASQRSHDGTDYDFVYWFDRYRNTCCHSNAWQTICQHNQTQVSKMSILVKNTVGGSGWHNENLSPRVDSGCD